MAMQLYPPSFLSSFLVFLTIVVISIPPQIIKPEGGFLSSDRVYVYFRVTKSFNYFFLFLISQYRSNGTGIVLGEKETKRVLTSVFSARLAARCRYYFNRTVPFYQVPKSQKVITLTLWYFLFSIIRDLCPQSVSAIHIHCCSKNFSLPQNHSFDKRLSLS